MSDTPTRLCPCCKGPKTGTNPFLCITCADRQWARVYDPKRKDDPPK